MLYKVARTPNLQYQWDFLRRISDPLDHLHQVISIKKFSALGIASPGILLALEMAVK